MKNKAITQSIGKLAMVAAILIAMLYMYILIAIMIIFSSPAEAHVAATGWVYPISCCGNYDCKETKDVKERPEGYVVPSGEVIAYDDNRIRYSPDGVFHWCSFAGSATGKTICLFVPPRGF